jgi:hypothetical protein
MKNIIILLILIFPLLSMAQGVDTTSKVDMTPKVIEDATTKKKYFMFDILQSKEIAKQYAENDINREKILVLEHKVVTVQKEVIVLNKIVETQKKDNEILEQINKNKDEIITKKDEINNENIKIQEVQSEQITDLKKKVERKSSLNKILIGSNTVAIIVAVVLYLL